jgi:hypothetical protein
MAKTITLKTKEKIKKKKGQKMHIPQEPKKGDREEVSLVFCCGGNRKLCHPWPL